MLLEGTVVTMVNYALKKFFFYFFFVLSCIPLLNGKSVRKFSYWMIRRLSEWVKLTNNVKLERKIIVHLRGKSKKIGWLENWNVKSGCTQTFPCPLKFFRISISQFLAKHWNILHKKTVKHHCRTTPFPKLPNFMLSPNGERKKEANTEWLRMFVMFQYFSTTFICESKRSCYLFFSISRFPPVPLDIGNQETIND